MPLGTTRFSQIAGRRTITVQPQATLATAAPAILATAVTITPVTAQPVGNLVHSAPVLSRQARLFPQARLDHTRVLNPEMFEHLHPIRVRPVLEDTPGCPAGGAHDHAGSANYTLAINRAGAQGQPNWRWCRKCMGLAFGGGNGVCPKGGAHDLSQSGDYVLLANLPTAPAGFQPLWRWCSKCMGLAFAGGAPGPCPAGGLHDHSGSGNYLLAIDNADAEGQPDWRWCHKCMGLAYAGGTTGATRDELALPVASSDPIDADAVFEAASGPERQYLPRYALARRVVSGSEQYEIRMAAGTDGQWALRVALAKLRPPGIGAEVASELPHGLLLQLHYALTKSDGGTTTKTLDFTEIGETADKAAVVGVMRFASPAERDQVLWAITNPGAACGITATRSIRVAVPIPGAAGRYRPVTRGMALAVEPDPLFLNPALHGYLYDGAAPTGGAPGLVARQLQFNGHFHDYWEDAVDPTRIYYLPDGFRLARRDKPAPFTPLMSVRVVPGATPQADPQVTLEFAATPWSDPARLDAARREFARRLPAPVAAPATGGRPKPKGLGGALGGLLGGRRGSGQDALGDVLGGVVGQILGDKASDQTVAGISGALAQLLGIKADDTNLSRIQMEPLPVDNASFWLALPGAAGGGLVERPAAQIDVRTALVVAETLPLTDFQPVYDALLGGSVAIMKGEVRVDFGGGSTRRIPFDPRFEQMNGELFETVITPGAKPGHFAIALTNAVESPLEVKAITASLLVGGYEVAAAAGFDPALPRNLAPGENLRLAVQPKVAVPLDLLGDKDIAPMLDLGQVRTLPDSEAIWAAILDADTAAAAGRTVRVKLFPGMFAAPSGKPEDAAVAVIVQFDGGPSLELTPEAPAGEVRLAGSVSDIILRRPGTGGYRYRCQIIRRSARLADTDWRDDSTDLLIPLLPPG